MEADDFALIHLQTAIELPEVFTECDLQNQLFSLVEFTICVQRLGPFLHLAQGLCVSGDPCQPMCSGLVLFDQIARYAITDADQSADAAGRLLKDSLNRWHRCGGQPKQIVQ